MSIEVATSECDVEQETPDLASSTDQYARRFAGRAGEYLLAVQSRILLEFLAPWPGASVLDVGGGHAQAAIPLVKAGYEVTVLGSSHASLDRVRRLAPGIRTAAGKLCDPPFEARSFDVVVALRMMPHVREWRRLVHGLCRMASRAVVVDYPTPASMNAMMPLLFAAKRKYEGDTRRFAMMRRSDVRSAFCEHGFERITERPQFFWPMVLHRGLNRPGLSRGLEGIARRTQLTRMLGSPVLLRAVRQESSGG